MITNNLLRIIAVGVASILLSGATLGLGVVLDSTTLYAAIPDDLVRDLDPAESIHVINKSANRSGVYLVEPMSEGVGFVFNAGSGRYYKSDAVTLVVAGLAHTLSVSDHDAIVETTSELVGGSIEYTARYADNTKQIVRVELENISAQYKGIANAFVLNAVVTIIETDEPEVVEPSRNFYISFDYSFNGATGKFKEGDKVTRPNSGFIAEGDGVGGLFGAPISVPSVITDYDAQYRTKHRFAGWYLDKEHKMPFIAPHDKNKLDTMPYYESGVYTRVYQESAYKDEIHVLALFAAYVDSGYTAVYIGKSKNAVWNDRFLGTKTIYKSPPHLQQGGTQGELYDPTPKPTFFNLGALEPTGYYYIDYDKKIEFPFNAQHKFGDTQAYRTVVYVELVAPEYTVTYNLGGGEWIDTAPMSQKCEAGSKLVAPRAPLRDGYVLDYWRTDYYTRFNFETGIMPSANLNLTAVYRPIYSSTELGKAVKELNTYLDQDLSETLVNAETYTQWTAASNAARQYLADGFVTLDGVKEWQRILFEIQKSAITQNVNAIIQRPQTPPPAPVYEMYATNAWNICVVVAGCILILGIFVVLALDKRAHREVK